MLQEDAVLLSYEISDLDDFLNTSNLRFCLFHVQDTLLAIATFKHVLIMEGSTPMDIHNNHNNIHQNIQITEFIPEHGYPLSLQWISHRVVAVGFDSGYLVCFDETGSVLSEFIFQGSPLMSIKSEIVNNACNVWLLYEKGIMMQVQ